MAHSGRTSRKKSRSSSHAERKRGSRRQVLSGKAKKTPGGLSATSLKKNKAGRIVSRKKSEQSKSRAWPKAVQAARKRLGLQGFVPVGGSSAEGQKLLSLARRMYR
jgi:hypothetical protein